MLWNTADATLERSPAGLYEACIRRDDDAIAAFVRRYQPELAAYARRHRADDPEGMADLATFDTVRRLPEMRRLDEPAVRAYLYRALKGRLIDEHRAAAAPHLSLDQVPIEPTQDGPESPVMGRLGFRELLDLLTPAEREVVSHRFVAGYTSVETAERVGRSPDAVRRLQSNALARLRLALSVLAVVVVLGTAVWLATRGPSTATTEPIDDGPGETVPVPAETTIPSQLRPGPGAGSTPTAAEPEPERATGPIANAGLTTATTATDVEESVTSGATEATEASTSTPSSTSPTTTSTPTTTPTTGSTMTTTSTTKPAAGAEPGRRHPVHPEHPGGRGRPGRDDHPVHDEHPGRKGPPAHRT